MPWRRRKTRNLKTLFQRVLVSIVLSGVMTIGSVVNSSTSYVSAEDLGITSSSDSDYRKVTVWGWPLSFATDRPYAADAGQLDQHDTFFTGEFLFGWMIWLTTVASVYWLVIVCSPAARGLNVCDNNYR